MDKTLQITFYKGETSGIKILEFTKGETIGFLIPKSLFNQQIIENPYFKNRITNCGLYFLSGDNIYIGQAINLFERIKQHIKGGEKEFNEIICFTTTNNSFDEGDINYLEKITINIAQKEGSFNLMNLNKGNKTNIKEYRKSDLNGYVEEIKFLLNILGYKFLENISKIKTNNTDIYIIKKGSVDAKMIVNENGYVVLAGSKGAINSSESMSYKSLKEDLLDKGILEIKVNEIKFIKDYAFKSSSAAAQILLGYSVSGPKERKNIDGQTLGTIEEKI